MSNHRKFPEIGEEFFRSYGVRPSAATFQEWNRWLGKHKDRAKYIKCLALCAAVAEPTVEKWLSCKASDYTTVGREHVVVFQKATRALGRPLPRTIEDDGGKPPDKKRGPTRVALFTSLSPNVSEPYHLAVIRSMIRAAATENVALLPHELPWGYPMNDSTADQAGRFVTKFAIDAVVMIRLTPTARFLKQMQFDGRPVPVMLVHADRRKYRAPVVANVVPDHSKIQRELSGWLCTQTHIRGHRNPKVVMVTMQRERQQRQSSKTPPGVQSIRNERIARVWAALEGFKRMHVEVPDYSFRHAIKVWEAYRDASAYVCLSDQLALGLKILMLNRGFTERDCRQRIVGFDGTPAAEAEKIVSLSQSLEELGDCTLKYLCQFLARVGAPGFSFPLKAEEIFIPVRLENVD